MASTSTADFEELEDDPEKENRKKITQIGEVYDEVLQGNRELEAMYKAEEDFMISRLKEVQFELREIQRIRDEKKDKPQKTEPKYSCYSAGKPYFKDSNFNQPPPNEDTMIMKKCDMYDFSTVMSVSGWNFGDTSNLRKVLLKIAQERETKRLYSELALLSRIKPKNNVLKTKIEEIMSDISNMKFKKLTDLDPSSYEDFDWDEVALVLNHHDRRHSAREYKSIWNLLLKPSVKMDKWSPSEHLKLQQLAREFNMQNWDAIAKKLNIKRTGYQCFVYYRTNMDHASCGRKWTVEEMDRLRDIIISQQEESHIPWGKVAALMPNRTKVQCYNKYTRMMIKRKGRFFDEEDAVILNYVNVFDCNYKNMAQFMFGRSSVQCRNRHALLKRPGPSATWTEEDDEKLLMVIANSDGPCTYASSTRHFGPGKDRNNLRSRYHTLKNWIKKHPHSPTRNAPRRAPRRLPHGEPTTNLITALENLRRRINELTNEPAVRQPKPKTNRLCRESSDAYITSALRTQITSHRIKLLLQENISKDTMQVRSSDSIQTLPIQDIVSCRPTGKDVYHLNLLLYILNTRIADKEKFQQSDLGQGFKELEQMEKQGLVKKDPVMRSYSRKTVLEAEPVVRPDLYSGRLAGRRKYLLPPNLATLTGSRVILSHLHKQLTNPNPPQPFDLKRTLRCKPMANAAIIALRERFNDLFVWPYNLSNNAPRYYSLMEQECQRMRALIPAKRVIGVPLPDVPMVTIPPVPRRRKRIRTKNTSPKPKDSKVADKKQKKGRRKPKVTLRQLLSGTEKSPGQLLPGTEKIPSQLLPSTSQLHQGIEPSPSQLPPFTELMPRQLLLSTEPFLCKLPEDTELTPSQLPPGTEMTPSQLPLGTVMTPSQLPTATDRSLCQLPPGAELTPRQLPPFTELMPRQLLLSTEPFLCKLPQDTELTPSQLPPGTEMTPSQLPPGTEMIPSQLPPGTENTPSQLPLGTEMTPSQLLPGTEMTPSQLLPFTKFTPSKFLQCTEMTPSQLLPGTEPFLCQLPPGTELTPNQLLPRTEITPSQLSTLTDMTPSQLPTFTEMTPSQLLPGTEIPLCQLPPGTVLSPSQLLACTELTPSQLLPCIDPTSSELPPGTEVLLEVIVPNVSNDLEEPYISET